jgi:hypothetical protein
MGLAAKRPAVSNIRIIARSGAILVLRRIPGHNFTTVQFACTGAIQIEMDPRRHVDRRMLHVLYERHIGRLGAVEDRLVDLISSQPFHVREVVGHCQRTVVPSIGIRRRRTGQTRQQIGKRLR